MEALALVSKTLRIIDRLCKDTCGQDQESSAGSGLCIACAEHLPAIKVAPMMLQECGACGTQQVCACGQQD